MFDLCTINEYSTIFIRTFSFRKCCLYFRQSVCYCYTLHTKYNLDSMTLSVLFIFHSVHLFLFAVNCDVCILFSMTLLYRPNQGKCSRAHLSLFSVFVLQIGLRVRARGQLAHQAAQQEVQRQTQKLHLFRISPFRT